MLILLKRKKKLTCKELYELIHVDNNGSGLTLFGNLNVTISTTPEWLKYYKNNAQYYDYLYLTKLYSDVVVDDSFIDDFTGTLEMTKEVFKSFDEIERIFETLQLEYDPIANVDGKEVTTHSGIDTHKFNDVKDDKNITGSMKEHVESSNNNTQNGTLTNEHSELANMSNSMNVTDKNRQMYDNITNNTGYQGDRENSYDNYNESIVKSGNEQEEYGHVITFERHGNIGTTRTQDMVLDEWNLRKKRFFDYVYKLWVDWFTTGAFSDWGC